MIGCSKRKKKKRKKEKCFRTKEQRKQDQNLTLGYCSLAFEQLGLGGL